MVSNFFDNKNSSSGTKNENMSDQQLTEGLHKRIIGKCKKRKVLSTFIDNIQGASFAVLASKFNRGFRFALCVIDISVYTHGLIL